MGTRGSRTGTRGPDFSGSLCHSLYFTSNDEPKGVHKQLRNRIGFATENSLHCVVSHVEEEGQAWKNFFFFFYSGRHVQARGDKAGEKEWGALFERHKSSTGLGEGVKVGDVTELAAGPALSAFLSAL